MRAALAWFAATVAFIHLAAVLAMDVVRPRLRDPEYGWRAAALRERVREHPGRPLVLVVGSSRAAMGVRPGAWESARPGTERDPLLFNLSTVGGGPIQQLLAARRAYDDGFRPAAVLLEYWPPLLRQDGTYGEAHRLDARRLRWSERALIRSFFADPEPACRRMAASRLNVLGENRERLQSQIDPELVPKRGRPSGAWAGLDGWGWLPGMDPEDEAERWKLTDHQRREYCDRLRGCAIHPDSDRALREAVALIRANGARVGFLFLPESAEFRSWYPPEVESAARSHLAGLSRELGVPVIDARDWMDECDLADGFHLSRAGAAAFTARLGPAVAEFLTSGGVP